MAFLAIAGIVVGAASLGDAIYSQVSASGPKKPGQPGYVAPTATIGTETVAQSNANKRAGQIAEEAALEAENADVTAANNTYESSQYLKWGLIGGAVVLVYLVLKHDKIIE